MTRLVLKLRRPDVFVTKTFVTPHGDYNAYLNVKDLKITIVLDGKTIDNTDITSYNQGRKVLKTKLKECGIKFFDEFRKK